MPEEDKGTQGKAEPTGDEGKTEEAENGGGDKADAKDAKTDPLGLEGGEPKPDPLGLDKKEEEGKKEEIKYELSLPESTQLVEEDLAGVEGFAKEKGLSAEVAQSLVEREGEAVSRYMARSQESFEKVVEGWHEEAKTDPEFGGDKFDEVSGQIGSILRSTLSKEDLEEVKNSPFAHNPIFRRLLARFAKRLTSSDNIAASSASSSVKEIPMEVAMFGEKWVKENRNG